MTRLKIGGFKRLRELDIEMRPLVVMLGANGAGKTSLLEALSTLSCSAQGKLSDALFEVGGADGAMTRKSTAAIGFEIEARLTDQDAFRYELTIQPGGGRGYTIPREKLEHGDASSTHRVLIDADTDRVLCLDPEKDELLEPTWPGSRFETTLSQVPRQYRTLEQFRTYLGSSVTFPLLDMGRRAALRIPQQLRPAPLPDAGGETFISYLHFLREEHPHNFDSFLDILHVAFKSFEGLSFPSVGAGMFTLTWKDSTLERPLYIGELSEGTLRFIWLAALLHSPALPAITMIDEPEVSIHPDLLNLLVDLFREASQRTQLIVATHSERLIRHLSPSEILAMDLGEDGFTEATWADSLDVEIWLEKHGLDEIWRMGQLGARA